MFAQASAIEGTKFGGIGPGISPAKALSLDLKVDLDALPSSLVQQVRLGKVDLDDSAITTLVLLKLNAVVGVTGHSNPKGGLKSVGIQCALCHSTVDNALAPGISHRLDGWANGDLNVGAIVAATPNLQPIADLLSTDQATVRKVLNSWGPGKFVGSAHTIRGVGNLWQNWPVVKSRVNTRNSCQLRSPAPRARRA
jgi:hypothetical protein